ncbi:hypothetical protein BC831DRAFT_437881 [Entophlyctis helioformis]|nr:hypothetical protein BC831DRAFT_437881 [Entophlyctis helioformis]
MLTCKWGIPVCIQHLFQSIHNRADPQQLKSLKKLLAEVRPSRSKWANEDRIGQEQLYESLEKVLNELKNYTEHSVPFLKPVQKREAPNYYDIIKHPMDLGTMTKKLKALQYNSKDDFTKDLNLIWTNCFTYNTLPESIYRRHATAMKRKATELLKKVPEIVIKITAADESESDDDVNDTRRGSKSTMAAPSKATRSMGGLSNSSSSGGGGGAGAASGSAAQSIIQGFAADGQLEASGLSRMDVDGLDDDARSVAAGPSGLAMTAPSEADDQAKGGEDAGDAATDKDDGAASTMLGGQGQREDPADDPWMQTKKWKQATLQYRKEMLWQREEQNKLPFAERRALVRTTSGMDAYVKSYKAFLQRNRERRVLFASPPNVVIPAKRPADDETETAQLARKSHESKPASPSRKAASAPPASPPKPPAAALPFALSGRVASTSPRRDGAASSGLMGTTAATTATAAVAGGLGDATSVVGLQRDKDLGDDEDAEIESTRRLTKAFEEAFLPELKFATHTIPDFLPEPHSKPGDLQSFYEAPSTDTDAAATAAGEDQQPPPPAPPPPSMSEYPDFVPNPKSILHAHVVRNILEFQRIKAVYNQILAKQHAMLGQPAELVFSAGAQSTPFQPTWDAAHLPPTVVTESSALAVMRKACSLALAHSGFDGTTESALAALTEMAMHYMLNLGRTLQQYVDKHGETMSAAQVLVTTLELNGVPHPLHLDTYIRHDVIRMGSRLTDLRRKLESALADLEAASDPERAGAVGDDVEFDESREQLMSGNFFQDMGLDFLGLKDFGIDLQSIPLELWNQKAEKPVRARVKLALPLGIPPSGDDETERGSHSKMREPEAWPPIDPAQQIELLKPFYEAKSMSVEDLATDEKRAKSKDEKLLLKYAQQGRKRMTPNQAAAEDAKKRKKKLASDPAVKAAREAELLAKRTAAKAERLRVKEEKEKRGAVAVAGAGAGSGSGATGSAGTGGGVTTRRKRTSASLSVGPDTSPAATQ